VDVEVLDLCTLVPLDEETLLSSVRKTGRLVVAHEAVRRCGFGAEVSSIVADKAFDVLKAPVKIVAAQNTPIPFSLTRTGEGGGYGALPALSDELKKCTHPLEEMVLPQKHQVVQALKEVVEY
jgi:pyruvate/2-oxoglutarate/acetoin dehydrogenase E1 component